MLAEVRARQRTAPAVQHRGRSADARLVADDLLDLPLGGPGPAMLSLIGARGVLWTRPLALPALR
jgi:hypothetical protein